MSGPDHAGAVSDALGARLSTEAGVWLATTRPNGTPHLTPVWFVFEPESATWWISTGAGSVKVRNIDRQPEVSLALEDGRRPVVAEGTARVHPSPFPSWLLEAFAEKYDGWDITVPYAPGDIRVLLEIPTTRWLLGGG